LHSLNLPLIARGEHGYNAGNRQGTEIAMKIAFAAVEVAVVELLVVGA